MSKVSKPKEAFGIKTYPHVKFFGKGDAKKTIQFKGDETKRNLKNFKEFLVHSGGVKI